MKRFTLFVIIGTFVMGMISCGGGKYADLEAVLEKMTDLTEDYIATFEKADNAKDTKKIVSITNKYVDRMKPMQRELLKLREKYAHNTEKTPRKIESLVKKYAVVMLKMTMTTTSIKFDYLRDDDLRAALDRIDEIMIE